MDLGKKCVKIRCKLELCKVYSFNKNYVHLINLRECPCSIYRDEVVQY